MRNVSAASWPFKPGEPASLLIAEIRRQTGVERFDLAVVLGSGWKDVAHSGRTLGVFDYADWPCFPAGHVAGHGGQLIAAKHSSWNLLFFSGRFHCYQGLSAFQAAFPVCLSAAMGCPRILLTCATGGINPVYQPGEFMLVEDHMNFLGDNPLRGLGGDTFIDLAGMYQRKLYKRVTEVTPPGMILHRGILAAMPGPSYETPAEIAFLAQAGADVVSMSTVHEAIMARYLDLEVAAVAFVANPAAGLKNVRLTHDDVLSCSAEHAELFPVLARLLVDSWQSLDAEAGN